MSPDRRTFLTTGGAAVAGLLNPFVSAQDQPADPVQAAKDFVAGHEGKLKNESFVGKAPPEVVANVRETLDGLKKQLASVEDVIRDLG